MPVVITTTPDFPIWMKDGAMFADLIDGTAVWTGNNTFSVTVGDGVYSFTGIGLGQRDAQGYPHSSGTITSITYESPQGSMSITGLHAYASALFGSLGDPVWIQNNLMQGVVELHGGNAGDWLEGTWINDIFYGGAGDDYLNGGDGSNHLFGEAGDDILIGGGPNPNVAGYEGDDYLVGGLGKDQMFGGLGDDTYLIDNAGDRVFEWGGEGTDTVASTIDYALGANVENLLLSGGVRATGNALGNVITGNAADNIIDGGKGADLMRGGNGSDTYYVDNLGDRVFEGFGNGVGVADHVISTVTFNAAVAGSEGIENITLSGSGAANVLGNNLGNVIVGNSANNGLTGGSGADTLTGGKGDDTFIYKATSDSSTTAFDRITDLSDRDRINLSAIDANTHVAGNQAFSIVDSFTKVAGQMTLTYSTATHLTTILMDVNGDGKADMKIVANGDHHGFDNFVF